MTKETITLIHLNNVINDLITMLNKDTDDGVSTKMFDQFMEDFRNIVNDNPCISKNFNDKFKAFVNHLNTDVDSIDKQSRALSKIVLFNGKYMSSHK